MTQVSCRGLLFDLDGVLIDSTPAVARVWTNWAAARGFDPEEVVRKAHGRPSLATIRDFLPNADHEAENRRVERCEIEDVEGVVPLPGARELLEQVSVGPWAIVTSCTRALAEVRIRVAGLPFPKHFVTSTDISYGKPHPEPYLKGASMLAIEPEDCIVFEDAPAGIRAGKAAGCRVVGFRTISLDPELQGAGADWIVDNCASVSLSDTISPGKKFTLSLGGTAGKT